jgi:hypothetical protein
LRLRPIMIDARMHLFQRGRQPFIPQASQ